MNKIEHFLLPEETNSLYKREAISSISLTKEVADKINEIVDSLNELSTLDLTWKQTQEGTIRKAIVYIKDNLMNTLHDLIDTLENTGYFDGTVKKYVTDLEARVDNLISNNTVDGEVVDGRLSFDNITYKTLGKAIRTQIKHLNDIKQSLYGSYEELDITDKIVNGKVYNVWDKTLFTDDNGQYLEYTLTDELFLAVSGRSWSAHQEYCGFAFFDEYGVLIKKYVNTEMKSFSDYVCEVPVNAKTLIINNNKMYNTLKLKKLVKGNLNEDITKLKTSIDVSTLSSYKTENNVIDVVNLSEDNTEIIEGKLYTNWGSIQEQSGYDTLIYKLNGAKRVLLNKYNIGVFGGAFLTDSKSYIKSFDTSYPNNLNWVDIPDNASYIAVSVKTSNRYKSITFEYTGYKLIGLANNSTNLWNGKKVVWIGTSVPFGTNADTSYAYEIAKHLNINLVNCSAEGIAIHTDSNGDKLTYGSLTLSKDEYSEQGITVDGNDYYKYRTYENIFNPSNSDADLYVFDVVPNNGNFGLSDYELFDFDNWKYSDGSSFADHRTTFIGSVLFLMDKMYSSNSNARMVFVLGSSFKYEEGKENFKLLCEKYHIPLIDLWGNINISPKSLTKLKSEDGSDNHPSTFAHEIMGKMLIGEFMRIS